MTPSEGNGNSDSVREPVPRNAAPSNAELQALIVALVDGTLRDDQFSQLENVLAADPQVRADYHRQVQMHTLLMFSQLPQGDTRKLFASANEFAQYVYEASNPAAWRDDLQEDAACFCNTSEAANAAIAKPLPIAGPESHPLTDVGQISQPGGVFSAVGNFNLPKLLVWTIASMLVGSGLTIWLMNGRAGSSEQKTLLADGGDVDGTQESGTPAATLVNVTNCRWDKSRSTADLLRGSLRPGQSLHLLEGVARIHSVIPNGSVGKFQLEGPLAMSLTDEGMPSLAYGKLAGEFSGNHDHFTLGTPLGRVMVMGDTSIGVKAAANDVELHVFAGAASLDVWSTGPLNGNPNQLISATAGSSIRVRVSEDGNIAVEQGKAQENGFVTAASLAANQLLISDHYVAAIREAKPIAYWRFESESNGVVRNEMANRWHCHMQGDAVRLRSGPGNRTAEFGMTAGPGYLISDDLLSGVIADSYSLEAWVKPTYFHHGALFSLIQWSPTESPVDSHRFHLELCGPNPGVPRAIRRSSEVFPGRIRFINQSAECYSSSAYHVRRWQHIAAVKDKSSMRLYSDGELVAHSEDQTLLGNGLRIMMGQLYPQNSYLPDEVTSRLFVGELDEVALYDRALSEVEIKTHFKLARPAPNSTAAGQDQDS